MLANRRQFVATTGLLTLAATAGLSVRADAASRATFDPKDPRFNMLTLARLQNDLSGKVQFGYSKGRVFGLNPGAGLPIPDYGKRLYDYEGASVSRTRELPNGDIETVSRSWLFYTDPATGAYLKEWRNPYTGQTVPVPPFRGGIGGGTLTPNGPKVSANFTMESTVFNRPTELEFTTIGDKTWVSRAAFTRWTPKGATQARTEMTLDTWVMLTRDLLNPRLTSIPATSSWTSQTEFQTWLKNPPEQKGAQLWKSDGTKMSRLADLPPAFVAQCNAEHPGILTDPLEFPSPSGEKATRAG
ncbi:DUF1838 family protein [Sandaracinobacteroides saxicola]|uniref:DUF1838 family protein n=1 Tax=Sandaracinobacteroides saxicola TaxID=2759707 RepID=A0A7G5IJ97_9SPHN|nr:DUF1838 family protein [Sandaracinobacteroides saxicola]QMW23439.1 DUF1838 family protein [Sandaracinobacteroides saxicola]